jgi:dihydroorotase-like cyclic amidohydrolase
MEEKDYAKSFKDFIESIGFSIDKEGRILDASKRTVDPSFINCHVVGFIPDKPYIKPNC